MALGNPDRDLSGFPQRTYRAGTLAFRAHRNRVGPWWFCSDLSGRFDLPPAVGGTCYVARDACTALREALGVRLSRATIIPRAELEARHASRLRLPGRVQAADMATSSAANFGITREISGSPNYEVPQRWALRLREHGFDAISYEGRFDPSRAAECLALFSETPGAGSYPNDPNPRPATQVAADCGIRVGGPPPRAALTVINPQR